MRIGFFVTLFILLGFALPCRAQQITVARPLDLITRDTRRPQKIIGLYLDRHVYWSDDAVAHGLLMFTELPVVGKPCKLQVAKAGAAAPPSQQRTVQMTTPKLELIIDIRRMTPGDYVVRAAVEGVEEATVEVPLRIEPSLRRMIPVPAEGIPIEVQTQDVDPNGAWPITTGVPFPYGSIADGTELTLYENDKPIASQFTTVTTWQPKTAGFTPHVRWGRLTFIARYDDGKPRTYALRAERSSATFDRITLEETDDLITVNTGKVKFTISRRAFDGIHEAWLDQDNDGRYSFNEQAIKAADHHGPYVTDGEGAMYTAKADTSAKVWIDEAGPVRTVVAAEGWYVGETGKFCKFNTRLIAHVGEADIQVEHHTIVTFNTDEHQIADSGFRLPVEPLAQWRTGLDGKPITSGAPMLAGQRGFVHQYRWDKARLIGIDGSQRDATRCDGYVTALPLSQMKPAITVALRDMWQKFPKEISIGKDHVDVHFWPAHGIQSFTTDEMHSRENIYKLWWYHQGSKLDLKFPRAAYDQLKEWDKASSWAYQMGDPEGMSESALGAYGEGLVIGNDFVIKLHARDDNSAAKLAAMHQFNPWARPPGEWNTDTGVEDDIAPHDPHVFPLLEKHLDTAHTDLLNVQVGAGTEYGMWNYVNTHNHWSTITRRAHLHRVWQAGHYRQVYGPWLLLFRGASFENLTWARAAVDHFMNIDTINWSNPDTPLRWHQTGAMYHAKGFLPWGATRNGQKMKADIGLAGTANHFVNPDALLMTWLMVGDHRAREVYFLWADVIHDNWGGGLSSREYVNTFGEVLNYYRNYHDPEMLLILHRGWKPITTQSPSKLLTMPHQYAHSVWHKQYLFRLYNQVRDPAIIEAVRAYAEVYQSHTDANTFLALHTGDVNYINRNIEGIYNWIRREYLNPGDPLHGFDGAFHSTGLLFYQSAPYWIHAAKLLGITELKPTGVATMIYPYSGGHFMTGPGSPTSVDALVLDETDQPFNVTLEGLSGIDQHTMNVHILSPSNKHLVNRPHDAEGRQRRYIGEHALRYTIPADGEIGLYRVQVRSHMVVFKAPYTDAPYEGISLTRERLYKAIGKVDVHAAPVGDKPFTLTFAAVDNHGISDAAYARVTDAQGATLLETSVVCGSQRDNDAVTIDPTRSPGPYHIETISGHGPTITWTGDITALIFAADPAKATRIAVEFAKTPIK